MNRKEGDDKLHTCKFDKLRLVIETKNNFCFEFNRFLAKFGFIVEGRILFFRLILYVFILRSIIQKVEAFLCSSQSMILNLIKEHGSVEYNLI